VKEEALRILVWLVVEVLLLPFYSVNLPNFDLGLEFLALVLSVFPHANKGLHRLPLEELPLTPSAAKRPVVEVEKVEEMSRQR